MNRQRRERLASRLGAIAEIDTNLHMEVCELFVAFDSLEDRVHALEAEREPVRDVLEPYCLDMV